MCPHQTLLLLLVPRALLCFVLMVLTKAHSKFENVDIRCDLNGAIFSQNTAGRPPCMRAHAADLRLMLGAETPEKTNKMGGTLTRIAAPWLPSHCRQPGTARGTKMKVVQSATLERTHHGCQRATPQNTPATQACTAVVRAPGFCR